MIQNGSYLNVIDNSGAKIAYCIKVVSGYRSRYAFIGNIIVISIKSLRSKRRSSSKTKKGEIYKAVIVRTKTNQKNVFGDNINFFENSVVLLNKQYKFIGTRVFGSVPKSLRYTKYLKLASLSSGLVS
jgi:large subunit ribosomal protein L14